MIHAFIQLWHTLIELPLITILTILATRVGLGWAIILLTIIVRLVLWPFNYISFKYSQQMADLQGEIAKLKKKHKDDSLAFQKAQAQLLKDKGVVPAAGCLPGIIQFILLIALYRVFLLQVVQSHFNLNFFWLNLSKPDSYYILPVLAALFQAGGALFFQPKGKSQQMKNQQQMMIIMSIFTLFIASKFASGIVLFWVISSFISLLQQFIISHETHGKKAN